MYSKEYIYVPYIKNIKIKENDIMMYLAMMPVAYFGVLKAVAYKSYK